MTVISRKQIIAEGGCNGDVAGFMARYSDEGACARRLFEARYHGEWSCPRCGGHRCAQLKGHPRVFQCSRCSRQFSVTAGTAIAHSHVPLPKWFYAFYFVTHSKRSLSGIELARMVEVNEHTGDYMLLRIRGAMSGSECLQRAGR